MARKIRFNELENRTNRLKLPINSKPVYVKIGPSLSLGYRRNRTSGMWVMRIADGKGGMTTQSIGHADDYEESNGQSFLTFFEAQDKARKFQSDQNVVTPLTVQEAVDNYLIVLKSKNAHTAYDTRLRLEKHFLPEFKDNLVSSLTKTQLEKWLSGLVAESDDSEVVRKSKDSANRILTMVKAFLNHAVTDQAYNLNDSAWRLVKPFKSVGQPRSIRYTNEDIVKLIASAPDQSTGKLIKGAFLTGTRYGEMASAKVSSVDFTTKTWNVYGKTGSRKIILQQSAVEFFQELTSGKSADDALFTKEDGQAWSASRQTRPVKAALEAAGLSSDGNLYGMRHSYISTSIEGGIPLNIIAKNCGTSVRMIEKTYAHILDEKQRAFIENGAPSLGK